MSGKLLTALNYCLKRTDGRWGTGWKKSDFIWVAGALGDKAKQIAPLLVKIYNDNNHPFWLRNKVLDALAKMKSQHNILLPFYIQAVKKSRSWNRVKAIKILGKMGKIAHSAVPTLLQMTYVNDLDVQNAAIEALGSIVQKKAQNASKVINRLKAFLKKSRSSVQLTALYVLCQLQGKKRFKIPPSSKKQKTSIDFKLKLSKREYAILLKFAKSKEEPEEYALRLLKKAIEDLPRKKRKK